MLLQKGIVCLVKLLRLRDIQKTPRKAMGQTRKSVQLDLAARSTKRFGVGKGIVPENIDASVCNERWREAFQCMGEQRRMPPVGLGTWHVGVQSGLHHQQGQDGIVLVLDVAAKLVLFFWEELGVGGGRKVEDLSGDVDVVVPGFNRNGSGLRLLARYGGSAS
jgi:hypothetical protein